MATFSRVFDGSDQNIGSAIGALVDTTEEYTTDVDLSSYEGTHVECTVQFGATSAPDPNVFIRVYPSTDSTYSGTEIAVMSFLVTYVASTTRRISFPVTGYNHFRLGFQQHVAVANDATVDAWHRRWRWTDE